MKKIVLIFLFANTLSLQAQILNVNTFNSEKKIVDDSFQNKKKVYNGFSFHYSYQHTSFAYSDFNFSHLKQSYGNSFNLRYLYHPIILDYSTFSSYFSAYISTDIQFIKHRGFELSVAYVLPIFKNSNKISPYIGAGYQFSTIYAEDNYKSISALWKAGTMLHFSENFFINLEMKSSFKYKMAHPFNQYSVGIGIRGEPFKKTLSFIGKAILVVSLIVLDFY